MHRVETGLTVFWQVTVEGAVHEKTVTAASSPTGTFLYLNIDTNVVSVGQTVKIQFRAINANPADGFFYYLVSDNMGGNLG